MRGAATCSRGDAGGGAATAPIIARRGRGTKTAPPAFRERGTPGSGSAPNNGRRRGHARHDDESGLSAADQQSLKALLTRLATHVNALDPVDSACTVVEEIAATRP